MYQPIESYGIIGNMRTAALVGSEGSIDWLCAPAFDSPTVFAALLDDRNGGYFRIAARGPQVSHEQFYWPHTNVLVTRFLSPAGLVELIDFMTVSSARTDLAALEIVRRVRCLRGSMVMRMECRPAFNYARNEHTTEMVSGGALFRSPALSLTLATDCPLQSTTAGIAADFTLEQGQEMNLVLRGADHRNSSLVPLTKEQAAECCEKTVDYWRRWIAKCQYRGRWREMVERSALTLELLTYEPTGAVVAAPTTSLPEEFGGSRNWDYRCSWIRDSSFTVYGLLRVGLTDEATRFMNWINARCEEAGATGTLQTLYGIDGRRSLPEETLDHLDGYKGSRPVRIGNAASDQVQMDIYGELLDSVYLYNKYVAPVSWQTWSAVRGLVDRVAENWTGKDQGLWEMRSEPRHFVYSKLMCWVALDRGLRLADKRSLPANREQWLRCRDQIYEQIMTEGWSQERQAFVQSYGAHTLDAANLMMSMVFFMSPSDPRMLSTLDAIHRPLERGGLCWGGLLKRYNETEAKDGVEGREGTFNMCTFWLVEALTRAGATDPRKLDQALFLFESMLHKSNHLGLYAEETGPAGEAAGNFPQAFTHLAFISAAFNLDRTLDQAGYASTGD